MNVFINRWYRISARCEYTYLVPVCGWNAPEMPVSQTAGAVLLKWANSSGLRMLLVVTNDWVVAARTSSNDWLIVHGSVVASA